MQPKLHVPEHILQLKPYPPGKPIEETKREYGISEVVKLASNENPLGPSPLAMNAVAKMAPETSLYPDGSHHNLKKALSARLSVHPTELSIGCGSNEFIDLLPRVFVEPGANVVTHQTAFVIYKLCSQLNGRDCLEAPVRADFTVDPDALLKTVNEKTQLVFLANPNNPTGTWLDRQAIEHLATELQKRDILFVLDYAYWEFVENPEIPDPIEIYRKHSNVAVLRTFSKAYGLAGLRVGYCIAHSNVISFLERSRQPFNVTAHAMVAAEAALGDQEFLKKSITHNRTEKKALAEGLTKFPLKVYPSEGNFLLVDFQRDASALYTEFLKQGVIIRPVSNYGLKTFFRISVGLKSEHEKLFSALKKVL